MHVTPRLAAAVAALGCLPLLAGCNLQKSANPFGPLDIRVEGGPSAAGPVAGTSSNRAPDPVNGERLPLPDMSGVVARVAAEHPDALRDSCGDWRFMDLVIDDLRKHDTRWGYNWKRGNVGDPSHDVVDYHWGGGPDEGSTEVYVIDLIVGHCGGNPGPGWADVTDYGGGTLGRWTGRGRF